MEDGDSQPRKEFGYTRGRQDVRSQSVQDILNIHYKLALDTYHDAINRNNPRDRKDFITRVNTLWVGIEFFLPELEPPKELNNTVENVEVWRKFMTKVLREAMSRGLFIPTTPSLKPGYGALKGM